MTSNNDLVKAEIRAGLQIGDIVESLENGTWYKERVRSSPVVMNILLIQNPKSCILE